LADLYARSIRYFGPHAYAPEQVEAWAATASPARIAARCEDGRVVLVAVDERDRPLGYGDLEADGHLDFLYCAPEAEGKGIGSALYRALEKRARLQGIASIHVEASELARPLFERNGFRILRRNEVKIGAVTLHNFSMEKLLEQPATDP
jgi:putative acetyltransferase